MPRSKPILIMQSIVAGLGILLGGAALAEFVDQRYIGLAVLLVGAAQGGLSFYLSATNIPAQQVLAVQSHRGGDVVAGPASSFTTGAAIEPSVPVGEITIPPA